MAVFWIALGTILIGGGGLLATYGWNLRSSAETNAMFIEAREEDRLARRLAMLRTLAAEFTQNAALLQNEAFHEKDPEKLKKFVRFPRLQGVGVASAITSGVFSGQQDAKLFQAIVRLQQDISELNDRLTLSENEMIRTGDSTLLRTKIRDGALVRIHQRMADLGAALLANGINPHEDFWAAAPASEAKK